MVELYRKDERKRLMNWSRRVSLSDELARASIFVFRAIVGQFAIPEPIVVIQPWIILLFPTAQLRAARKLRKKIYETLIWAKPGGRATEDPQAYIPAVAGGRA